MQSEAGKLKYKGRGEKKWKASSEQLIKKQTSLYI